jgi:predicted nucleic acid-binding protein
LLKLEIVPLPLMSEIKKISEHNIPVMDIPVLVSVLKCRANFFVTGDKGLIKAARKGGYPLKILNPSEFLDVILPEILQ